MRRDRDLQGPDQVRGPSEPASQPRRQASSSEGKSNRTVLEDDDEHGETAVGRGRGRWAEDVGLRGTVRKREGIGGGGYGAV